MASTVAIQGLKDWQCADLQGIQAGDLLEIAVFEKVKRRDSAMESDEGKDDGSEDGENESDEGNEDDQRRSDKDSRSELDEGSFPPNGGASPEIVNDDTPVGEQQASEDGSMYHERTTGDDQSNGLKPQTTSRVGATYLSNERATQPPSSDMVINASADGAERDEVGNDISGDLPRESSEPKETQEDSEAEDEEDAEDGDHEDSDGDDEDMDDGSDDDQQGRELSRELYVILGLTKEDGDNEAITDVELRQLEYQHPGDESDYNTFRIYGDTITLHSTSSHLDDDDEAPHSLQGLISSEPDNLLALALRPSADHIRTTLFHRRCPANACGNGWLNNQDALQDLVDDDLEKLRHFRPPCPVCMGKDLMNEQVVLRGMLDTQHVVDIGMVVEYLGRLNPRRRQLGYSFVQFDERDWGYGFDDMLDEDDEDGEDGGGDGYEHWDEAMDPNSNPKTRPASKDTLAALPRKTFAEVEGKEEGAFCAICQDSPFVAEAAVVDLPCGHLYDEACLEAWIKEYDSCPECRATISGMVAPKDGAAATEGGEQEAKEGASGDDVLDEAAAAEALRTPDIGPASRPETDGAMDGQDTIMSDAVFDAPESGAYW